jgi:RHS repeat-associated protein
VVAAGGERLLHDGLGSIVGRVRTGVALARYGVWGALREGPPPAVSQASLAYAGQHLESAVGLSYAQQRWYDAGTGRFLSEDPVWGRLDTPASLHSWVYAEANPARFVDPRGTFASFWGFAYRSYLSNQDARESVIGRLDELNANADRIIQESSDHYAENYGAVAGTVVFTGAKFISSVPLGGARLIADPVDTLKNGVKGTGEQLVNLKECARIVGDFFGAGGKCAGAVGTIAGLVSGFALLRGKIPSKPTVASKSEGNGPSLASRLEANAEKMLARMEAEATSNIQSSYPKKESHFFSRHGAGTTIEQQHIRATTGMTPDGVAGNKVDSSRFFSHQLQLQAAQRAQTIFRQTGKTSFSFDMKTMVGEGFTMGGGELFWTSNVTAVFKNGQLMTLYPKFVKNQFR